MPHQVVARPDPEGNVYIVRPLDGEGPSRTVNRRELLDSRQLVSVVAPDQDVSTSVGTDTCTVVSDDH